MRKIFTSRIIVFVVLAAFYFSGCAFTEYGNRINQEAQTIARQEDKRQSLETSYIIVLNSLESHPTEEKLIKERDRLRDKLRDIDFDIQEKRKALDQSFIEWEQKIVQEKVEKQMIDKEVHENMGKDEDVEFQNK